MGIFEKILQLLYPRKCGICGEKINERYTCGKCLNIIEYYKERVELSTDSETYYDKILSATCYKGLLKQKMWQFKFRNQKYIAASFSEILLTKMRKFNIDSDIIIAVPISKKRMRERGYNQCELIAKYLEKISGIKYQPDVLIKTKNNLRQSELTLSERKINVKNAYSIKNIDIVKNKKIIILDDIFTTGATMNECAKILKEAGAKEVVALTVMYAKIGD